VNLVLVGAMGSGKSTVGRLAAAALRRPFADTDEWVEAAAGASVAEIFAREGEAGFREREAAALRAVLAAGEQVVATGGGIVVRAENRAALRAGGAVVVLLWAEPEELWRRLASQAASRPRLLAGDPVGMLRDDLQRRGPLYREVADVTVAAASAADAARQAAEALLRAERQGEGCR
jgi:shikimate kinase